MFAKTKSKLYFVFGYKLQSLLVKINSKQRRSLLLFVRLPPLTLTWDSQNMTLPNVHDQHCHSWENSCILTIYKAHWHCPPLQCRLFFLIYVCVTFYNYIAVQFGSADIDTGLTVQFSLLPFVSPPKAVHELWVWWNLYDYWYGICCTQCFITKDYWQEGINVIPWQNFMWNSTYKCSVFHLLSCLTPCKCKCSQICWANIT